MPTPSNIREKKVAPQNQTNLKTNVKTKNRKLITDQTRGDCEILVNTILEAKEQEIMLNKVAVEANAEQRMTYFKGEMLEEVKQIIDKIELAEYGWHDLEVDLKKVLELLKK